MKKTFCLLVRCLFAGSFVHGYKFCVGHDTFPSKLLLIVVIGVSGVQLIRSFANHASLTNYRRNNGRREVLLPINP